MEYLIAFFFLCVLVASISAMANSKDYVYLLLGVDSLFAIGYYILPIFFKAEAGLTFISDESISTAISMHFMFYCFLFSGVFVSSNALKKRDFGLHLSSLDKLFSQNYRKVFIVGYLVWILYFSQGGLTSYSADDFEAFFHERTAFQGMIAAIAQYGVAAMAVSMVFAMKQRSRFWFLLMLLLFGSCIVLLLVTAQRLALLTPIFTIFAALAVFGEKKRANLILLIGIVTLLISSPFLVYLRELQISGVGAGDKLLSASGSFSFGDELLKTFLQSIMQRSDLIAVTIDLKNYFDNVDYVNWQYYESVITSFIPSILYPDKPYPLSDDGSLYGHISVIAWTLAHGNSTGSLTAFGAISAYREAGWIWVAINGFLTGILFTIISKYLAGGGVIAKVLFAAAFVTICIKNVPPSLFELIVSQASTLYVVIVLIFLNKLASNLYRPQKR